MGSITAPSPSRAGIMVVNPRLHEPITTENADIFSRWTKLHFRDLLGIPTESGKTGGVTRTLRFVNGAEGSVDGKYGYGMGMESILFYTIFAPAISIFRSPQYYAVSRRLDLENTRPLLEGEEKVGCEEGLMVWDVVGAYFTIYEEVELDGRGDGSTSALSGYAAYADVPESEKEGVVLVGLGVSASGNAENGKVGAETVNELQAGLVEYLKTTVLKEEVKEKVYTTVYRNAGTDAQPDMHPHIGADVVGGGDWLVLLALASGEASKKEDLESVVGKWVDGVRSKNISGVEIRLGVWKKELDLH
ncbi:hypothetical protein FB567DRAFT_555117 [Paraphoma chrysanthemicola]|uniref:Uncharacterized protein n=1 Tax=Paraphoma chrysanthemicola TaxID=798071 RepID=A0A8K0VSK0_9PLEO|nr:hypothetical protein FB567DRAFT_555117 [Paraphoma chrysanthemicola]